VHHDWILVLGRFIDAATSVDPESRRFIDFAYGFFPLFLCAFIVMDVVLSQDMTMRFPNPF
jgi:hypothetical protein